MTLYSQEQREERCAWCGRRFVLAAGPGRPRRYCRPSHRRRAYEARALAQAHMLGSDQVLISARDLVSMRDLLYQIESALDDVDSDLSESDSPDTAREALRHLYAACQPVRSTSIVPIAVGADR